MKIFITLVLLTYIPFSIAKSALPASCSNYEEVAQSNFISLNKMEFIQLGQCVGRALIQKNRLDHLAEACSEVIEDNVSPLGILSLSKLEAIKIGQCLGAVAYINDRYHGKTVNHNYYDDSYQTYSCTQGNRAAELLSLENNDLRSAKNVRAVICELY